MRTRTKLIKEERDYLEYLHTKINDDIIKRLFISAVHWRLHQAEMYRKKYYSLRSLQALLGIIVVTLATFRVEELGIPIAVISALSSLVSFSLSVHKYFDSWKRYRCSVEDIKSLTIMYISKIKPFKTDNHKYNDKYYVLELNKIITNEVSEWNKLHASATTSANGSGS
ncbi:MAG: DUF4231 domain-containing protein [Lachnoclostridium sp.]|jgi:hypothetical protein|nr:DUF4231 domain-containing protein [Lachnoclostridium sp.]